MFVSVAKIGRSFGICSYFYVHSYVNELLNYKKFYIKDKSNFFLLPYEKLIKRKNGKYLIKIILNNNYSPLNYINKKIKILEKDFPKLANDEFYIHSLEKFEVVNKSNKKIGNVHYILNIKNKNLLVVKNKKKIIFIPYIVDIYICKILFNSKRILVDWKESW